VKSRGIHIRLLLAVFTLICAATFTFGALGVNITRQFMSKRFEERMSFLAKYLALNAEVGVLIGDRSALESLASNLLGQEDVARVTILDNDDTELVNIGKKVSGSLSVAETSITFKKFQDDNILFTEEVGRPSPTVETIGKVRITYSNRGIDELMGLIKRRFIYISVGLTLLAGLVFYFISRSIVLQVTQLARAARKVAGGDLELRAQPGNLPETRELALAFNAMLDSLAGSREALAKANEEVVRQNALAEMGKLTLMIAHEVKNPLSIIKSSLDILKKKPAAPSSGTMIFYMDDEIRRLNLLIEDLLAFARPATPTFRRVDLNGLIEDIVGRFELQTAQSALDIEARIPSQPVHTSADPDLLTRAFVNIIKNGLEANEGKGVVRITASCSDKSWVVDVEDQGDGIASENMDRIFEPFFTTRAKGTGLGLAFSLQVIDSHGGIITAGNREAGGAVFRVELPMVEGP
jgi:signal transduction histidine kinase